MGFRPFSFGVIRIRTSPVTFFAGSPTRRLKDLSSAPMACGCNEYYCKVAGLKGGGAMTNFRSTLMGTLLDIAKAQIENGRSSSLANSFHVRELVRLGPRFPRG